MVIERKKWNFIFSMKSPKIGKTSPQFFEIETQPLVVLTIFSWYLKVSNMFIGSSGAPLNKKSFQSILKWKIEPKTLVKTRLYFCLQKRGPFGLGHCSPQQLEQKHAWQPIPVLIRPPFLTAMMRESFLIFSLFHSI